MSNEPIEVSVPVEGYDVTVSIHPGAIRRELEQAEQCRDFQLDGPQTLDLSRFAQVEAEPSADKWTELSKALVE